MKTNLTDINKTRPSANGQRLACRSFSAGGPSLYRFLRPSAIGQRPTTSILAIVLLLALTLPACQKELSFDTEPAASQSSVNIRFQPVAGTAPLDFQTSYSNMFSEPFTVKAFKFYITGLHLVNTATVNQSVSAPDHYLVDAGNPSSTLVPFKAGAARYNAVAFTLGVDSLRNMTGAQTGALDPAKGMFWTWNSGYIMAKLEGNSPVSVQPNNMFEYHIGGFRDAENVVKRIVLPFPLSLTREFKADSTTTITISANINNWFYGRNNINISVNPVCTTPGQLARMIADNYADMFTVVNIQNN